MELNAVNLERAVAQFYHTDAAAQAQAHKWLTEVQNSRQAWAFVWDLLQPDKSAEVQFFAATTLHMKVVKAWAEVPVEQYATLRKQLLQTIVCFSAGPKIVLNRLCIALSAYVLQTVPAHWPHALPELVATLQPAGLPAVPPDRAAWILLQVLTVLPEEFQSSHLAQRQKALVRNELQNNIPLVLSLLEEILSCHVDSEVGHQGVLCTAAWLQLGVPMPDCERLAERLIAAVYAAAAARTPIAGLVESALEALSSMMSHPDTHKYPATCLKLLARLLPLHALLQSELSPQEDLVTSVYSLFVSIAESHSRLLLDTLLLDGEDKQNVMQLIRIVLECSNCPGVYPLEETTSQLAMGFWFILQDDMLVTEPEQQRILFPLLVPVYRALAEVMLRKSTLPDEDDPSWTGEDKEALRCYRQDVADTMMYCYSILREDLLAVLLANLESCLGERGRGDGGGGWRYLESCLHAFLSVAECVDPTEAEYLPRFMAAIQRLPFAEMDMRTVATALDAVGAYGEWINAHPAVLAHVVPLLVMGLSSAEVAPSATMALKDLARDCQAGMQPFAQHILQASQAALRGGHLKLSECVRLMFTVGRVLAVLPVESIMDYLNQLLMPYVEELQQLVEQEPSATVKGAILLRLKMISMLFATLDIRERQQPPAADTTVGPIPREPVQPVYLVLERILPVLQATLHRWHSDTLVIQAVCSTLKHALTTLLDDSKPLLPAMLALLVKSYQLQPSHAALDLARQFVVLYGREEPSLMHTLVGELCTSTLRLTATAADHTDVMEAFFNLLSQILKKNPQLLASSATIDVAAVFACGVETLGLQEGPTIKAAASFLVQFVTQSRDLPVLTAVVQAQGEGLVVKVLRCIGGESPRNSIEPMADILLALNKKYCDNLCRWLSAAVAEEGFPSPRATRQQSQAFAKAVVRERANRRKLQEMVREFSLVCRGLVGTEYAAQSSLAF